LASTENIVLFGTEIERRKPGDDRLTFSNQVALMTKISIDVQCCNGLGDTDYVLGDVTDVLLD